MQSWQHIQRKRPGKPHNLLREFYANPQKYGYVFQNYIFMTRFLQQQGTLNSTKKLRIMERSVFSDRNVFVESAQENGWLSELEFDLFNSWFCPMVNVSVFLTCLIVSKIMESITELSARWLHIFTGGACGMLAETKTPRSW